MQVIEFVKIFFSLIVLYCYCSNLLLHLVSILNEQMSIQTEKLLLFSLFLLQVTDSKICTLPGPPFHDFAFSDILPSKWLVLVLRQHVWIFIPELEIVLIWVESSTCFLTWSRWKLYSCHGAKYLTVRVTMHCFCACFHGSSVLLIVSELSSNMKHSGASMFVPSQSA